MPPKAPEFSGFDDNKSWDVYMREVSIYRRRCRDYLPANEQALALLDGLKREAARFMSKHPVDLVDADNGIEHLLEHMAPHYQEDHVHRASALMDAYHKFRRGTGESIPRALMRLGQLKEEMAEAGVAVDFGGASPEQQVHWLFRALRLTPQHRLSR